MEPQQKNWQQALGDLLAQAVSLCVEHDVDPDAFMKGAWSAYLEQHPGMREQIEQIQLLGQLEAIRKAGRMGQA